MSRSGICLIEDLSHMDIKKILCVSNQFIQSAMCPKIYIMPNEEDGGYRDFDVENLKESSSGKLKKKKIFQVLLKASNSSSSLIMTQHYDMGVIKMQILGYTRKVENGLVRITEKI